MHLGINIACHAQIRSSAAVLSHRPGVKPLGYTQHVDSRFEDRVLDGGYQETDPIAGLRIARTMRERIEGGELIQWRQDGRTDEPTLTSEAPSRRINL